MKGVIFTALFVVILTFSSQVDAEEPLKLSGEITSIKIEDKGEAVAVLLVLKMSFVNTGNRPVLLLKEGYPPSSPYAPENGLPYLGICSEVSGVLPVEQHSKVLFSRCSLPSIEGTSDWQELKRKFDSKMPPSTVIGTVNARQSFEFRTSATIRFRKKRDLNSSFQDDPVWSEIKAANNLSLRLTYRIWSLELEPRSADRAQRPFGKKLQKRWEKYGYLLLEDIVSEPIALTLD